MKVVRHTPHGIEASGPYTPGVEMQIGDVRCLFVSGQGTRDPKTGQKYLGDMETQATLAMENLKTVIESAGYKMDDIMKVTLFLTAIADTPKVNEIYKHYFSEGHFPARSTVAVKELPGGQNIEIEAIAYKSA